MTTVSAGTSATVTLTGSQTVEVAPDQNEEAQVVVTRSGVQVYGGSIRSPRTIGPFLSGDVFTLTAVRGAVDYTLASYSDPAIDSAESAAIQALVSGDGNPDGAALLRGGFVLAQRGAPASVTGTTVETLLCPAVVVPAGVLGLNGMLRIESAWSSSGTLNNRIHTIKIGATTVFTRTRNTVASVSEVPLILIQNRGSLSSQLSMTTANLSYGSNLTAVPATLSIDFSVAQSIYFYGQLGNSADTLTLESYNIRLEVAP